MLKINPNDKTNFVKFLIFKNKPLESIEIVTTSNPINLSELIEDKTFESLTEQEKDIVNYLKNWNFAMKYDELELYLTKLEHTVKSVAQNSSFLNDLIFSLLYSNKIFVNLLKKSDLKNRFSTVCEIYESSLNQNLGHVHNFDNLKKVVTEKKKDQGVLDWDIQGDHVVTRFPPEPNGYIHIGHARAALLNNYFATKNNGTLRVRFDDTNPSKSQQLYEDSIIEDLGKLGIKNYVLSHTSDHFDKIIEYAKLLIKKGLAYCDDTEAELMKKERDIGKESKRRNVTPEENLRIFDKMIEGEALEYCLRAKIDYLNENKALRDPVLMRHNTSPHHRTFNKYKLYPTYDFACPIVDSVENVSHTLRTNEFRARNDQYKWFLESLELKNKPRIYDFARLNFANTFLSKRKLKFFVENNLVDGWEDPRMPTIRGILRLGMNIEALKEYIIMQGASQKNVEISWDKIWALNKKYIDPISPRYSCVEEQDVVSVSINNLKESKKETLKHKKNEALGNKSVFYSDEIYISQCDAEPLHNEEEFTLMNWGNAVVKQKIVENGVVKKIVLDLKLDGDYKTTKYKINWVSKRGSFIIRAMEYTDLIKSDKETEDMMELYNKDSKTTKYYIAESAVSEVKAGEFVQFERLGFFICDDEYVFNLIPYTKQVRK